MVFDYINMIFSFDHGSSSKNVHEVGGERSLNIKATISRNYHHFEISYPTDPFIPSFAPKSITTAFAMTCPGSGVTSLA